MNLRQKSSRYCAAVLFFAAIAAVMLIYATIRANFQPSFEIWLALALVSSLILHARAGFALSRAQQEIELLRGLIDRIRSNPKRKKTDGLGFAQKKTEEENPQDALILDRVKSAIENDRIDLYLQPIVNLPQRETKFFEAYSRLRNEDGSILRPLEYLEAAERANRIGVIDNMIILRAVQALRNVKDKDHDYRIFCNISPATIFDQDFFERFADYLDANSEFASRLVIEFTYPSIAIMHERVENNLRSIASRGYAFSVDHIRRFDLDWAALRARNIQFIKASSAMLISEYIEGGEARARVLAFKDRLQENGIELIVEKVEHEAHVPDLLALGIELGQGDLFGPPMPANAYLNAAAPLAKAS